LLLGGAVLTAIPKIVEFKESWDKLSAAGGKHAGTMNRVVTALSGITAAYAAATIGARMLADAQNASDKKANSKEIINRITGAKGSTELSGALDESFRGINDDVNTDRMTKVDDFGGALNRIYRPKMADSQQDFFSDAFMIKENGGGDKARKAFGELDKSLADLAGSGSADKATATFAEMQKRADKLGISVGDLVKLVPNYKDAMIDLATQNGLTNLTEEEKIKVLAGTSSQMDRAAMSSEAVAAQQQAAAEETQKWSEALAEIGVSLSGTIDNLATFTEFMVSAGLLTLSARDASVKFEESIDDMGQKIKDIMATEQQLGGVLNETRTDFDRSSEAGRAANIVYGDLATKGLNSAVAMAKAGEGQELIQGELSKTYTEMVKAGQGFGLTEDAAIALTREVLKVPAGVSIDSWMADKARMEAEKTKAAMDLIDGRVVKTYAEHRETTFIDVKRSDSVVSGEGSKQSGPTAYATGGAVIGPGMKGVDSVRSLLAPGEHVLTADEVDKMGGQQAVYAMRAAIRSGAAYSAPPAPVAASSFGAGNLPPIYIQSPVTGEYLLAQMDTRAMGVLTKADSGAKYSRKGRP